MRVRRLERATKDAPAFEWVDGNERHIVVAPLGAGFIQCLDCKSGRCTHAEDVLLMLAAIAAHPGAKQRPQ